MKYYMYKMAVFDYTLTFNVIDYRPPMRFRVSLALLISYECYYYK